jgi:hypothetical protein
MLPHLSRQAAILSWHNHTAPRIITTTATILPHEQMVVVESGGAYTVTLPSVAEAIGREFVVWCRAWAANITIADKADSLGWTNMVIDTVNDTVLLKSDGLQWHFSKKGVA